MKKCILLILVLALALPFSGCEKEKASKDTTSIFHNNEFPSFVVKDVMASAGEKDVVVFVKLKDNPGFLTMAMNIEYDSSAMFLTEVKNGKDYSEYNFIAPRNKGSGCTASWFIPELPDKIKDGKLLELHFTIFNDAKSGEYPVKITRPDNGGVVDAYKEILVINNAVGYVKVK